MLCFRDTFQIDQIHDAFHKDLGLWEAEIIFTMNDKQVIEANPNYLILKTTPKKCTDSLILLSSVSQFKCFSPQ